MNFFTGKKSRLANLKPEKILTSNLKPFHTKPTNLKPEIFFTKPRKNP